jgi:hypothetical protein
VAGSDLDQVGELVGHPKPAPFLVIPCRRRATDHRIGDVTVVMDLAHQCVTFDPDPQDSLAGAMPAVSGVYDVDISYLQPLQHHLTPQT